MADGSPRVPPKSYLPEGPLLATVAVLGALLMLATLLVVSDPPEPVVAASGVDRRTRPDVRPTAPPSTTTPPSSAPDGSGADGDAQAEPEQELEPVACPAGVDPVVCNAAAFVEEYRGRPFLTFPTVEVMDDAAFDEALLSDPGADEADLEAEDALLTAMGLIDDDVDLAADYQDGLTAGVVGFYDPTTEELVVRGTEFNLYVQSVLVHELVHAHDDQWADLEREAANDDADYASLAVIEGNASRVEEAWIGALSAADRDRLEQERQASISDADLRDLLELPSIVIDLTLSPYEDGLVYVEAVAAAGGEPAVNEALTFPPTTSEDILHPDVSVGGPGTDVDVEVAAPGVDGTVVDEDQMGELLLREWFGPRAAAGWAGDRYVLWTGPDGRSCVTDLVATDTMADRDELAQAVTTWVAERPSDRSLTVVTVDDRELLSISGCA
ncbi:MAG: hypothetical protein ACK5PP_17600 [Acidimicrobiales bacterium]